MGETIGDHRSEGGTQRRVRPKGEELTKKKGRGKKHAWGLTRGSSKRTFRGGTITGGKETNCLTKNAKESRAEKKGRRDSH